MSFIAPTLLTSAQLLAAAQLVTPVPTTTTVSPTPIAQQEPVISPTITPTPVISPTVGIVPISQQEPVTVSGVSVEEPTPTELIVEPIPITFFGIEAGVIRPTGFITPAPTPTDTSVTSTIIGGTQEITDITGFQIPIVPKVELEGEFDIGAVRKVFEEAGVITGAAPAEKPFEFPFWLAFLALGGLILLTRPKREKK